MMRKVDRTESEEHLVELCQKEDSKSLGLFQDAHFSADFLTVYK